MDYSGSSLGCARRNPSDVARSRNAYCLVENKHLRKCIISAGCAIGGTRANNDLRVS